LKKVGDQSDTKAHMPSTNQNQDMDTGLRPVRHTPGHRPTTNQREVHRPLTNQMQRYKSRRPMGIKIVCWRHRWLAEALRPGQLVLTLKYSNVAETLKHLPQHCMHIHHMHHCPQTC